MTCTPITQQLLAGGLHPVHDRPAALPAGLLPDHGAVPVQRLAEADRTRRRQHRPEVPRQDDASCRTTARRAATRARAPRRASRRHRRRIRGPESAVAMAVASEQHAAGERVAAGPGPGPGPRRRARSSVGKRFLTLREGSIIVVTLITFIYFAATTDQLRHGRQLQVAAAVLRAVRDHGGRRGVRDDPRRDRPVDRRGVPVHAVRVLQASPRRGRR